jgi:hypothetical protein
MALLGPLQLRELPETTGAAVLHSVKCALHANRNMVAPILLGATVGKKFARIHVVIGDVITVDPQCLHGPQVEDPFGVTPLRFSFGKTSHGAELTLTDALVTAGVRLHDSHSAWWLKFMVVLPFHEIFNCQQDQVRAFVGVSSKEAEPLLKKLIGDEVYEAVMKKLIGDYDAVMEKQHPEKRSKKRSRQAAEQEAATTPMQSAASHRPTMQIFVKMLSGKTFTCNVHASDSIASLNHTIRVCWQRRQGGEMFAASASPVRRCARVLIDVCL